MRSMSRMPTDLPCRVRARASWRVTEDLPTPPLPDSTYTIGMSNCIRYQDSKDRIVDCLAVIDKRRGNSPARCFSRRRGASRATISMIFQLIP